MASMSSRAWRRCSSVAVMGLPSDRARRAGNGSCSEQLRSQGSDHALHALSPVDPGGADEFVHAGGIDGQGPKGLRVVAKDRLQAGQLLQKAAPLLDADRLGATEVNGGDLFTGGPQQPGQLVRSEERRVGSESR